MNEKFLISIIVPIYNVEKYLEKCIHSLINQTYKNIELLLIDDGSPDKCPTICDEFAKKDNRITVYHKQNEGLSKARNVGLKNSKGDYIVFVDSDDWIDENTIEIAVQEAMNGDIDVVLWTYIREYQDSKKIKKIFEKDKIIFNEIDVKTQLYMRLFGLTGSLLSRPENFDSISTVWGKLYKREVIFKDGITFVDTKEIGTSEDGLFNICVFKNVKKAEYINRGLYHYRKTNNQSILSTYNENKIVKWEKFISYLKKEIEINDLENSFNIALNSRICFGVLGLGLNTCNNGRSIKEQVEEVKCILNLDIIKDAFKYFDLAYLPLHWKIFFFLAKLKCKFGIFVLLKVISRIIKR